MPDVSPLALLAPASGPGVGGGHVMRCLTLAEALKKRGARCVFAAAAEGEAILRRFSTDRFEVVSMDGGALANALKHLQPDALVLDDYATTVEQEEASRACAGRLVVIDDLADRAHPADLLIDPGYGRLTEDYHGFLPSKALCLTGPAYALVRPEFAALRADRLGRATADSPRRLFVSFGLGDVGEVAVRAVRLARATLPNAHIDVAIAASAESASALRRMADGDDRLAVHLDLVRVAPVMAQADIALGAGGASTWERACLGLPTLAVVVADNQRDMIHRMTAEGLLLSVDLFSERFEEEFISALERLNNPLLRGDLSARSASLCDGAGADRVAGAILAL